MQVPAALSKFPENRGGVVFPRPLRLIGSQILERQERQAHRDDPAQSDDEKSLLHGRGIVPRQAPTEIED